MLRFGAVLRGARLTKTWAKTFEPLPIPSASPLADKKLRYVDGIDALLPTAQDKAFFEENGYWTTEHPILTPESITLLRNAVQRVYSGELDTHATPYEYGNWFSAVSAHNDRQPGSARSVLKINNAWWINETIRQLSLSPVVGRMASELMESRAIRLWHDQAICKPGGGDTGGVVGWHQDYAYWQIANTPALITALVQLQDTTEENGCLSSIAGSHKWGLVYDGGDPGFFQKDLSALEQKFASLSGGRKWTRVANPVKAGQVTFHHALTFHGSGPNHTDTDRLALAVHMQTDGIRLRLGGGHHHNLRDLGPNAREGDPFVGHAFPCLYSTTHSQ